MERRAGQIPDGFKRALDALSGPARPMTSADRVEFESQKAKEMAKAEASRNRSPQLDLDLAV